jgi:hypothetical protein
MNNKHGHIFLLIFAFSVAVFVTGLYFYMYRSIGSLMAKTSTLRSAAAAGAVNKERERSFLEAYEATASKWQKLPDFFVSADRPVDFIEAIEALGGQSGAKVSLVSIDASEPNITAVGTKGTIRAHVSAQGSWQEVMRTLALVETLPYQISINNYRAVLGGTSGAEMAVVNNKEANIKKESKRNWNLTFDLEAVTVIKGTTLK